MRKALFFALVLPSVALADASPPVPPASEDAATAALDAFEKAFGAKSIEEKQAAVYALHDVPHDRVLAKLGGLLRDKRPEIRNVAALAIGGQRHDVAKAGGVLMKALKAQRDDEDVIASILQAICELKYKGYWPDLTKLLWDDRPPVVIRSLDVVAANKDWRATHELVKLFKEKIDRAVKWQTGEETVDTGAAGDADQKAAEAAWNAKYGPGGSKAKAEAKRKSDQGRGIDFTRPLRKAAKAITGHDFDTGLDFEDWLVENWIEVARKIAEYEGKDPEAAAKKAAAELPAVKKRVESERESLAKEAEEQRKQRDTEEKKKS
jgi:hypothetical protein